MSLTRSAISMLKVAHYACVPRTSAISNTVPRATMGSSFDKTTPWLAKTSRTTFLVAAIRSSDFISCSALTCDIHPLRFGNTLAHDKGPCSVNLFEHLIPIDTQPLLTGEKDAGLSFRFLEHQVELADGGKIIHRRLIGDWENDHRENFAFMFPVHAHAQE